MKNAQNLSPRGRGSKILPKIHFIYPFLCKLDENWRFSEKLPKLALGCAPRGMEQKFYQKVISYTKKVILSKFDENWRRNEDFMKNAKIWSLGGHPWGSVSKILPDIHFIYQEGPSVQIWWKSDEKERFSEKRPKLALGGTPEGGGKIFLNIFL